MRRGEYIARAVLDLLIPRHCTACGKTLQVQEKFLCTECGDDIPFTYSWNSAHNPMADRFNAAIQRDLDQYEPYVHCAGLFFFRPDSGYRHICHNLKYEGDIPLGRHFSKMLGQRLAASPLYADVDLVVPVPLHRLRRFQRGYNQAEVIAREVALCLRASLRTDVLFRVRSTSTQTRLDVEQKRKNVSGAFSASLPKDLIDRKLHILLVDDVFTTGSTLASCHQALREVFPPSVRISVCTLAVVE